MGSEREELGRAYRGMGKMALLANLQTAERRLELKDDELASLRAELAEEREVARGAGMDAERAIARADKAETALAERDVDLEAQSKIVDALRARLEAAERERDRWQREVGVVTDRLKATSRDLDAFKAEAECHSKNHDAALDQRDAALRELAGWKRECGPVLDALTGSEALCGQPVDYVTELRGQVDEADRQRDAANALLREDASLLRSVGGSICRGQAERIDAHLAASPSPLASPEGDGAGRECERPMDLIERSRADLDLMDYEGARRAQEVIHIYVCPNERCSGGLIMDGRGGVLGRCKVCNPRRAQGGDSNAEGSGA